MRQHGWIAVLAGALLLWSACGRPGEPESGDEATPTPEVVGPGPEELAEREARRAEETQVGEPELPQGGEPVASDAADLAAVQAALRSDADCPASADAWVRAERGASCATYEAEIAAFVGRCVAECDGADLARRTVQLAAARCSQFCSEKSCGTASFVPPPAGCSSSDCYDGSIECVDDRCPRREYCALLQGNRVWNCFCRDVIPN